MLCFTIAVFVIVSVASAMFYYCCVCNCERCECYVLLLLCFRSNFFFCCCSTLMICFHDAIVGVVGEKDLRLVVARMTKHGRSNDEIVAALACTEGLALTHSRRETFMDIGVGRWPRNGMCFMSPA